MNTLFHSDLLNFGTIILIIMIGGGVLVALTMAGNSAWRMLRRTDRQDEQADGLGHSRMTMKANTCPSQRSCESASKLAVAQER